MPGLNLELPEDIRNALAAYCRSKGIRSDRAGATMLLTRMLAEELGDDSLTYTIPGWGGWRGNEASLDNLVRRVDELTGGGRNDPAESDE